MIILSVTRLQIYVYEKNKYISISFKINKTNLNKKLNKKNFPISLKFLARPDLSFKKFVTTENKLKIGGY